MTTKQPETPLMRSAREAAERVAQWSPSRQEYARRVIQAQTSN